MEWVYDRVGDPGGAGHPKADFLRSQPGEWLTAEGEDGVFSYKKGGHLEVEDENTAALVGPFLWGMLPAAVAPLDYRRYGTTPARKTIDYTPIARNPGFQPSGEERWVGGGYIVQLCYAVGSGAITDPCDCWISLINSKSGAAEVLSLDPANVAGANVSFNDVAILPGRASFWQVPGIYGSNSLTEKPSIFATGWDDSVQGYGFGFIGRAALTDQGPSFGPYTDKTPWDIVCWIGNTATRTLTRVDIPGTRDGMLFSGLFRVCVVDHGRLMALVCPFVQTGPDTSFTVAHVAYPLSPCLAFRSDDHGRTWYTEDVPELQPHLYRAQTSGAPTPSYFTLLPGTGLPSVSGFDASTWHACPIGGGQIAMLLTCGKDDNYTYVDADFASPPAGYTASDNNLLSWVTRYKFLISDVTGRNFVLKASPMDSWDGESFQTPQNIAALASGTWSSMVPAVAIPAQYPNPISTAGPGSFFIGGGQTQSQGALAPDITFTHRTAMAYTVDYGESWTVSDYLDPLASTFRSSAAPLQAWHVAKPYNEPSDQGQIYTLSLNADETQYWLRIYRSDITFAAPVKVYEQPLADYYWQSSQVRISAVYTGAVDAAVFPARVFPGFTEFEKP